jgi:hypothetical protein
MRLVGQPQTITRAVQSVCVGAAIGLVVVGVAWIVGFRASFVLCVGLGIGFGLMSFFVEILQRQVRHVRPERQQLREAAASNPYSDLYFLEYRLSWGSVERDRYEQRVRPLLRQLALERLRQRHGIDPNRDPERCREIVGEQLWQLMTGPPAKDGARPPHPREVDQVVTSIERI